MEQDWGGHWKRIYILFLLTKFPDVDYVQVLIMCSLFVKT
jgi:hypothetical protein